MKVLGVLLILAAIALVGYLGVYVMLYGGVTQAIVNWHANNSAVIWGIVMAVFFWVTLIPGAIIALVGVVASE